MVASLYILLCNWEKWTLLLDRPVCNWEKWLHNSVGGYTCMQPGEVSAWFASINARK
jgi:hypothetical protein